MSSSTLTLKIGDDHTLLFTFEDEDGVAFPITGGVVKFAIKNDLDDSDEEAVYINENVPITDGPNGEATDVITDTISGAWTEGDYWWQARYIASGGAVSSTDVGACILTKNLIDNE